MENKNVNNNIKREKAFAFSGNPDELIAKYEALAKEFEVRSAKLRAIEERFNKEARK